MASLVRRSGAAVWFLVIIGLILVVGGLAWDASYSRFISEAESVQGVVANAERRSLGRRTRQYNVTVRYEIDGKAYGRILQGGRRDFSSLRAGDNITIYYRPSNPSRIVVKRSQGALPIAAGAIFIVLGIIFVIQCKKTNELIDWLKVRGRRVSAEVTSVEKKKNTEISLIKCVSKKPVTGQIEASYETHSAENNLCRYIGRQVTIYVHPDNDRKYYVDSDDF
jgi:hypothetical protein